MSYMQSREMYWAWDNGFLCDVKIWNVHNGHVAVTTLPELLQHFDDTLTVPGILP